MNTYWRWLVGLGLVVVGGCDGCPPSGDAPGEAPAPRERVEQRPAPDPEGCAILERHLRGPEASDPERVASGASDAAELQEFLRAGGALSEAREPGEGGEPRAAETRPRGRLPLLWDNLRDSDHDAFLDRAEAALAAEMGPITHRSSSASALARSGRLGHERLAAVATSLHARGSVDVIIENALPRTVVRPLTATEVFFGEGRYCGVTLDAPGCQELAVDLLVIEPELLLDWTADSPMVVLSAAEAAALRTPQNAELWAAALERALQAGATEAAMASALRMNNVGLPPEVEARVRATLARAGAYRTIMLERALWDAAAQLSIGHELAPVFRQAWERSIAAGTPDAYSGALAVWAAGSSEGIETERLVTALAAALPRTRGMAAHVMGGVLARLAPDAVLQARSADLNAAWEAVRLPVFADVITWIEAEEPASQLALVAVGAWRIDRPEAVLTALQATDATWRASAWGRVLSSFGEELAGPLRAWAERGEHPIRGTRMVWALRSSLVEDEAWQQERLQTVETSQDPQRVREALLDLRAVGATVPVDLLFRQVRQARPERRGGLERPHPTALLAVAQLAEQDQAPQAAEVISQIATRSLHEFGARELSLAAWLAARPCLP